MLLLITVSSKLLVNLHSDRPEVTTKAHAYLRDRMHQLLGEAIANEDGQAALAGSISASIAEADRVALGALGFTGVAVVQVFESVEVTGG